MSLKRLKQWSIILQDDKEVGVFYMGISSPRKLSKEEVQAAIKEMCEKLALSEPDYQKVMEQVNANRER